MNTKEQIENEIGVASRWLRHYQGRIREYERRLAEAQQKLQDLEPRQPETQRFSWGGTPTDTEADGFIQLEIGRWWNSPNRANRDVVGIRVIPGARPGHSEYRDQFPVFRGGIDVIIAKLQEWKEFIDAERGEDGDE